MVMMHFEQMFNFSQDKYSIAFIIPFFLPKGVCEGEGGLVRREPGREGGREKRCLRYFQDQPENIAWNMT